MAAPVTPPSGPSRLDLVLVARGLAASRARARDAILRGHVLVDGKATTRPGVVVAEHAAVTVADPANAYVARSALKLIAALDGFAYDPAGRMVLDLGASTGGFTQVLLERGATQVFAVDVGHGQLHPSVAADPRVVRRDGVNARDLPVGDVTGPFGAIVADLSFISLKLALPPALKLAVPGAWAVLLVKPQFEVGRERLGKGGIVRDEAVARAAADDIAAWLAASQGWTVDGILASPIAGGDGNREYLVGARNG